jgi:hypothetical protein
MDKTSALSLMVQKIRTKKNTNVRYSLIEKMFNSFLERHGGMPARNARSKGQKGGDLGDAACIVGFFFLFLGGRSFCA